jgi:hypothetical protein
MKYPLSWFHEAVRETICWVWGHHWITSWRRVRDVEPPGWTKRKQGNPYCEYVASWHYKCRRCRTRTSEGARYPLWREIWWALKNGCQCWWIGVTCYTPWPKRKEGYAYTVTPWYAALVAVLVGAPLFAIEQVWLGWFSHQWHFPSFPGIAAAEASHRIAMWVESKGIRYRWMPPQNPSDPHEIGFWLDSEAAKLAENTGQWRMRVWAYSGQVVNATGTYTHTTFTAGTA